MSLHYHTPTQALNRYTYCYSIDTLIQGLLCEKTMNDVHSQTALGIVDLNIIMKWAVTKLSFTPRKCIYTIQ